MIRSLINAITGKSMTLNFNALSIILLVLDVATGTDIVKNNPDVALMLTALGNILLRFKTNKPVSDK